MPGKWREKGGKEDQEYDGRTALREIWKEWEENGEQQRSWRLLIENVVREKRRRKQDDSNYGNHTYDSKNKRGPTTAQDQPQSLP